MSDATRQPEDPMDEGERRAIDGLLREWSHGDGVDERFVGGVMSHLPRVEARPEAIEEVPSWPAARRVRRPIPRRSNVAWLWPLAAVLALGLIVGLVLLAREGAPATRGVATSPASAPEAPPVPSPKSVQPPSSPAPRVIATLETATPGVVLVRGDRRIPAVSGLGVMGGDRIEVDGFFAAAVLRFAGERTVVRAAFDAALQVDLAGGAKRLTLDRGQIQCDVAPQPDGRPMTVRTQAAEATVLGTRFSVDAMPRRTRLDVTEGRVRFRSLQRPDGRIVSAGGFAEAGSDGWHHGDSQPAVLGFALIDASTGRTVGGHGDLGDGDTSRLSALPVRDLNIVALVAGSVGSVYFELNGRKPDARGGPYEDNPPYTMAGNEPVEPGAAVDYHAWRPAPGSYTLAAQVYEGDRGHGTPGIGKTVRFEIVP